MESISGDEWIKSYSKFIKANESQFSQTNSSGGGGGGLLTWIGLDSTSTTTPNSSIKPALMRLDPHHLFYLLIRFEALGLSSGQLDVKAPKSTRPTSYFSFISANGDLTGKDKDDTMSINSFRSTISAVSAFSLGGTTSWFGSSTSTTPIIDPTRDLKLIYSAFTKIPSLRLTPVALRSKLIKDFEDCPGSNSIPLEVFKNLQLLQLEDVDPRVLLGWDRLSCQLRSLSCKRSGVEDLGDLLIDSVVNDAKRRRGERVIPRRRIEHGPGSIGMVEEVSSSSSGSSEDEGNLKSDRRKGDREGESTTDNLPSITTTNTSGTSSPPIPPLPSLAWYFLRHLDLSHNSLTFLTSSPLVPLTSLASLDLSSNLLNAVPPSLSVLPALTSVNLSDNMIESLRGKDVAASLSQCQVLSLARNRLESIAGVESLLKLQRIDLRGNQIEEAQEVGRLAVLDRIQEVWCKNNPLEEEFPDWRVDVFVEFAKEGKRIEGQRAVKLDDELAGYFERQRIYEKVPVGSVSTSNQSNLGSNPSSRFTRQSTPDASTVLDQGSVRKDPRGKEKSQDEALPSEDAKTNSPPVKAVVSRRKKQASTVNPKSKESNFRRNEAASTSSDAPKSKATKTSSPDPSKSASTFTTQVLPVPLSDRKARGSDASLQSDGKRFSEKQLAKKKNRRIVDLDLVEKEKEQKGKGKGKAKVEDSTDEEEYDKGDMNKMSESEIIKRAARAGQVEEALGSPPKNAKAASTSSKSNTLGRSSRILDSTASGDPSTARVARPNASAINSRRKGVTSLFEPGNSSSSLNDLSISKDEADSTSIGGSSNSNSTANANEDGAARSEAWRRRIENLKGEVGDDWLRLLIRGDYDSGGRLSVGRNAGKSLKAGKKIVGRSHE